jgi:molybdate transport system substrate-binding protein
MAKNGGMSDAQALRAISSMATQAVLTELIARHEALGGPRVELESVGGVDAAKRVQAGEAFDLVFLAADAIDRLIASGHLLAGSRVDIVRSPMAVAVREGAARPDVSSDDALRRAVAAARTIGYSTGPSGSHLLRLFERWKLSESLRDRLVQARPGVPVASLVAGGEAELGFQQLAEMKHAPGVTVLGTLPGAAAFITTFSAGIGTRSDKAAAARALLAALNSADANGAKHRHGMERA